MIATTIQSDSGIVHTVIFPFIDTDSGKHEWLWLAAIWLVPTYPCKIYTAFVTAFRKHCKINIIEARMMNIIKINCMYDIDSFQTAYILCNGKLVDLVVFI